MRTAVYSEQGKLEIKDRPVPEVEAGWVRLRVASVGICGTDLHMMHGKLGQVAGLQPGHEVAGFVDAVSEGVRIAAGTLVALEPLTACGRCQHCLAKQYNRCLSLRIFGVTRRGGMAEYLTVPAERVYPVQATVPSHVAALAEPIAVCVRGVAMAPTLPSSKVAILGSGTIGLLSIVALQAAGVRDISITARHPHQQAVAKSLGAKVYENDKALLEDAGDDNLDVVVETVGGDAKTLIEATNMVKRGGHIVMLGVFEGAPRIPGLAFSTKELTLFGSNCYSTSRGLSDFAAAIDVLHANAQRVAPLVTHRFGLAEIEKAFAVAADKTNQSIKVQVEPTR